MEDGARRGQTHFCLTAGLLGLVLVRAKDEDRDGSCGGPGSWAHILPGCARSLHESFKYSMEPQLSHLP